MALDLEQFRDKPESKLDIEKFRDKEKSAPIKLDAGEKALATLRGLGGGVSLGLTQYPAAALMMGVRRLTGYGGPENTFAAALQEVKEQEKQLEQAAPYAYGGGKLAGSMMLLPGGGGALLPTMGRTAVMGGVSGFTEEERLRDAALGAGIGAVTAGALGGADILARAAGKSWTKSTLAENFDDIIKNWNKGGREEMESIVGLSSKAFEQEQKRLAADLAKKKAKQKAAGTEVSERELTGEFVRRPGFDKQGQLQWFEQKRSPTLKDEAISLRDRLRTDEPVENIMFRVGPRSTAGRTFEPQLPMARYPTTGEILGDVARGTVSAAPYAGLGYIAATAAGLPIDPTLAALGGGAFGAKQALAQAGQKALQASVMRRSLTMAPGPDKRVPLQPIMGVSPGTETVARALTATTTPYAVSPEEVTYIPEPVAETRTRLQELADRFRERFQQ